MGGQYARLRLFQWSNADIEKMKQLRNYGLNDKEIGAQYRCSSTHIRDLIGVKKHSENSRHQPNLE